VRSDSRRYRRTRPAIRSDGRSDYDASATAARSQRTVADRRGPGDIRRSGRNVPFWASGAFEARPSSTGSRSSRPCPPPRWRASPTRRPARSPSASGRKSWASHPTV